MPQHSQPATEGQGGGTRSRSHSPVIAAAVILVLVGVLLFLVLGPTDSTNGSNARHGGSAATTRATYAGIAVTHAQAEAPLLLRNYLGRQVNLRDYLGKGVFLTFIYTHCPDTCPLMVSHLHTALAEMSASERREFQIVAVSVDPRGDTPATVAHFLGVHGMTGRMQYLIGSATQLHAVWRAWGIDSVPDTSSPDVVEHTALIYGITGHGRIVVVYPANFTPRQIVHDAGLLARA